MRAAESRSPVLETTLGRLERGEALEWLSALAPGSVDLVVADPPYNLGRSEWDRFESQDAFVSWSREWIRAAQRALKPEGSAYVMGWSELLADVKAAVAREWAGCRWLVWFYRNKANLRDDWGRSHESILHLRNGPRATFNTDPVRIPYNAHTTRYPERSQAETSQYGGARPERWRPNPLGARPRDVIEVPLLANGTREKTAHPTQKPVQLIRKFVLASSREGDLVVDPFAGSGTTALVCETSGRRWLACELDARWCKVAADRIRDPGAFSGSQTDAAESALARRRGRLRADAGSPRKLETREAIP
ncbi:site-specific DNA-methyltransferase [bacterium]|nr:site-specific DNA-methyltransferase [bacterium]